MNPSDYICPEAVLPSEMWRRMYQGEIFHWCHACQRFRSGVCARVEAGRTESALRGTVTRMNGKKHDDR